MNKKRNKKDNVFLLVYFLPCTRVLKGALLLSKRLLFGDQRASSRKKKNTRNATLAYALISDGQDRAFDPHRLSDLSWNTCICYDHSLLPLLQNWQLQVSGGREFSVLVNHLLYKHAPPTPRPLCIDATHKKCSSPFHFAVRCAVRLETGRSQVQPPPRSATFFRGDWSEILSTVILSLPLIQEGQLSVSGERMCAILVNCLED